MPSELRKLPLWRGLLEGIIEKGINHGSVYDASYFEQELSCKRDSREFGLATHRIRVALERKGFYLQGHAIRDGKLLIIPPEKNMGIAKNREIRIKKDRGRSIALLSATDMNLLPEKCRPAHAKILMRIEIRAMIEKRSGVIHRFLAKRAPKLLQAKT